MWAAGGAELALLDSTVEAIDTLLPFEVVAADMVLPISPSFSSCNDGVLTLQIGDARVALTLASGAVIHTVADMFVAVEPVLSDGELSLGPSGAFELDVRLDRVDGDLPATGEDWEAQLHSALLMALIDVSKGGLSMSLPAVSVPAQLMADTTLEFASTDAENSGGRTLVRGTLALTPAPE